MSAIRLISEEISIYSFQAADKPLHCQQNYIFQAPAGKLSLLCFASHQNPEAEMHPFVAQAIKNDLGVVYICEKLPKNLIIDPHVTYLEAPYRWFLHTLFMNPLRFSGVFATQESLRLAQAFSEFTGYSIPHIRNEQIFSAFAKKAEATRKNVLVEVIGGVGDHLMAIPAIKTLDAKGYHVSILCEAHRNPCFQNLPYVRSIFAQRKEVDVSNFGRIIMLHFGQQLNDYRLDLNKKNRIYSVAELCGLKPEDLVIKRPEIILTKDELNNAQRKFGSYSNKIFFGSDSARVDAKIPAVLAQEKINILKGKGFTVFSASVRREQHENCIDLNKKLELRELFAIISLMDCVLTVDTSFVHIAAAFNKKTFCLLNYFKPDWRCGTYPNCVVYTPKVPCYPCVAKQFVASCEWQCHTKSCYEFFDWERIISDIYDFKLTKELKEQEKIRVIPTPVAPILTTETQVKEAAPGKLINVREFSGPRIAAIWMGGVGDTVMLGYLCRAILAKYPDAQIDAYVRDVTQTALFVFDYPQIKGCVSKLSWGKTLEKIKADYDFVYDFRPYPYVWNTKKPELNKPFNKELYSNWGKATGEILRSWQQQTFRFYAQQTELNLTEKHLKIPFFPKEDAAIRSRLSPYELPEKYITISPGCDQNVGLMKLWSKGNWQTLESMLLHEGYNIIYLSDKASPQILESKKTVCKNLIDMLLILQQASLNVSNEGGSIHLAHAVGTKSVVLFGPTNPELYGYADNINIYKPHCPTCWWTAPEWSKFCKKHYRACINLVDISVQEVYDAVISGVSNVKN